MTLDFEDALKEFVGIPEVYELRIKAIEQEGFLGHFRPTEKVPKPPEYKIEKWQQKIKKLQYELKLKEGALSKGEFKKLRLQIYHLERNINK